MAFLWVVWHPYGRRRAQGSWISGTSSIRRLLALPSLPYIVCNGVPALIGLNTGGDLDWADPVIFNNLPTKQRPVVIIRTDQGEVYGLLLMLYRESDPEVPLIMVIDIEQSEEQLIDKSLEDVTGYSVICFPNSGPKHV
jgi:hypothetical protein